MALVIQTEVGVGVYTPYERPPQPLTLWSAIPRGLQSFLWTAQLDLIGVGDDALLNLNATLPPNFAYVMADCNLTITQSNAGAEAVQWAITANLNLQNFYRASSTLSVGLSSDWPQDMVRWAQDDSRRTMSLTQPWPRFPIIGSDGTTGVLINLSTFNNAQLARAVGTINGYISFWQFDLEQVRKYPINSPLPTHAR